MPKYYVSSGSYQHIVDADDHKSAALNAFSNLVEVELSKRTHVSEQGFDSCSDEDMYFCTLSLLEQTGQIENYRLKDWL